MSDAAERPATVRRYVFYTEHRPSRAWMPTLEMINERFGNYLRGLLQQHLQPGIEVTPPMAIQLIKHGALIERLSAPSHLTLVNLKPLRGTVLLACDAELVAWVVESRFGGSGRFPVTISNREFTPFELNAMRRVVDSALQQLALAWRPIATLEPEVVRQETNPQFAAIANESEALIVSTFEVRVGGGGGKLTLAMPYVLLEPLHERLMAGISAKPVDHDQHWYEQLRIGVGRASMPLTVELAALQVTVRELMNLKPGSVFEMERPEVVTVEARGQPLFRGSWGKYGRKLAVRIEERLGEPPESDREKG
jgi:flagellar motor switch protein FliM